MKSLSLYKRCLWNFIRLIFLWILRGVPSNIKMGHHKQNPNTKSIKIHPVPHITEQQEAMNIKAKTASEKVQQAGKREKYSEPQWMKLGIMGAGSR